MQYAHLQLKGSTLSEAQKKMLEMYDEKKKKDEKKDKDKVSDMMTKTSVKKEDEKEEEKPDMRSKYAMINIIKNKLRAAGQRDPMVMAVDACEENIDVSIDEGPEFLNEAKINLKQIENLAGLSTRNDDHKALLEEPTKDNLSIFIGELRTLTEKRSQIKDSLHKVDDELIKLQEKIYKNKKLYEDKIAQLESINEIYSQSANIVSKIISEDTKYEQL